MAPSDGRREVPDSEDEPMTSSPVAFMDGAADKLSATARVPLQDAQDAPIVPARPHQANAENVANVPGTRTDGLDVDHFNALSDVDAKIDDVIDMQPDTMASEEVRLTAANNATHALSQQQTLTPLPGAVDVSLQSQDFAPEMTASKAQEDSSEAQHAHDTAIIVQGKPDDVEIINKSKQNETADHTEHLSASDARRVMHPVDAEEGVSKHHHAATNDLSEHSPQVEQDQQTTLSPVPVVTPQFHRREASIQDAEHADPTLEIHDSSKERSSDTDDSARSRSRCKTPEVQLSGPGSLVNAETTTVTDDTPVSAVVNTSLTSQEVPEACGSTSCRNENLGNEVSMATPTESYLKDNATASSSFASTATSASNPNSTRDTEMDITLEEARPAIIPPPATTVSTMISQPPNFAKVSAVAKTPQEITLAELKAQKAAMLASLAALPAIQVLMEENATSDAEGGSDDEPTESDTMKAANKIVKDHIKLLHEYNELKDVGQGLMGLIADQRGVRIVEVQEEFGIEAND